MSAGFVYFFHTAPVAQPMRLQAALLKQGLGLRLYETIDDLSAAVARPEASDEPRLIMLAAADSLNCQAAKVLRRVAPLAGVVALQSSVRARTVLDAMRSGIDACWPKDAPVQLVVSGVLRLMSRTPTASGHQAASPVSVQAPWRLTSGAWIVQAPGGAAITLTTAERALVLALCQAPGRRLGHAELMRVIEGGFEGTPEAAASHGRQGYARPQARRLSVLVSRLRRKLMAAGIDMPIRSLRRQGYEIGEESAGQEGASLPPGRHHEQSSMGGKSAARYARVHAVAAEPAMVAPDVLP